MQDLLALKEEYMTRPAVEETINDPTNPKHYWRYRIFHSLTIYLLRLCPIFIPLKAALIIKIFIFSGVHVTLESLLKDKEHIASIKNLVEGSGRSYPPLEDDESQLEKSTTHLDTLQKIAETGKEETRFDSPVNNGIPITDAVTVQ